MNMYPFKSAPVFQSRIWGGQRLRELFGKDLPAGEKIGESWEIADLPEGRSTIANGPLAGQTLGQVARQHGEEVLGTSGFRSLVLEWKNAADDALRITDQTSHLTLHPSHVTFPLLVKFLDAQDVLSVQVHPDPATCRRMGRGDPKTECWYIVRAEPGAVIYKGLKEPVTRERFAQAVREGTTAELLAAVPVSPGECHFVPAGAAHALGPGIVIAEIQTPSDTTYRDFDWNRVDDSGRPRQLHIDEALESIHFDVTPDRLPVTTVGRLVDSEYFKVDKGHRVEGGEALLPRGVMRVLIFLAGGGTIHSNRAEPVDFRAGDCLLIPAAFDGAAAFARDTEYLTVTL
jgi:mannose-6-phosphate isomerase